MRNSALLTKMAFLQKPTEKTTLIKKTVTTEQDVPAVQESKYPKAVFFIIGNEFCERFSYYGMRTILTIYLTQMLLYSKNDATMIFHVFTMACYFTPILGACIADSWLGKFKTIFYISIIYAIGNIVISVGSIPQELQSMKILSMIGLGLIAAGTGGIKPCVSAFGGDQFEPGQEAYLQKFFSFFYLSINLGSTISTFITPLLRDDVKCFGGLKCFPLAFGVPAVLMIVSLVLFLLGKPLYKIRPPQGNVIATVGKCIGHAVVQKFRAKEKKRSHWLDYADDAYDTTLIDDIKTVLHVLFLYIPLPIFWALFDQQGSRWTLQAARMDGRFFGYVIKPDQMQFFNPFLVIILIPLFEYCIYPILWKCHILVRPLQRITFGGLLAAGAFVVAGLVQLKIETTYPVLPDPHFSETMIINNSPCVININGTDTVMEPYSNVLRTNIPLGEQRMLFIKGCKELEEPVMFNFTSIYSIQSMMITESDDQLKILLVEDSKEKDEVGNVKIRIFFNLKASLLESEGKHIELRSSDQSYSFHSFSEESDSVGVTSYKDIPMGKYNIYVSGKSMDDSFLVGEVDLEPGGRYIAAIFQNQTEEKHIHLKLFTVVEPNSVHILHLVPQYVLITVGEIMFSITGLEFSYSQAPASMKSVLQAAWLLTVAFGNLIVVIVAETKLFEQQSVEFFMFATLMGLDMFLFAIFAVFYKYVESPASTEGAVESKANTGKNNPAYEEDTHF